MCLVAVGDGDIGLKKCDFKTFVQWEYHKVKRMAQT